MIYTFFVIEFFRIPSGIKLYTVIIIGIMFTPITFIFMGSTLTCSFLGFRIVNKMTAPKKILLVISNKLILISESSPQRQSQAVRCVSICKVYLKIGYLLHSIILIYSSNNFDIFLSLPTQKKI